MFKVSFKDKKVKRVDNNRATIITLTGEIKAPEDVYLYPTPVRLWINEIHPWIDTDGWDITVRGKSICSEEDTIDNVFGERLAEARAKLHLYKFMRTLCKKLCEFYDSFLYGNDHTKVIITDNGDSLKKALNKYNKLVVREKKHIFDLLNGQPNTKSTSQS